MPAATGHNPKGWATGAGGFTAWSNVRGYSGGAWKYAQRVFRCISPGVWAEVWNNRPVTTTGSSSSTYDSITLSGTVDPNNFVSTPRFYYKKSTDGTYTADVTLTTISGDGAQSTSTTISSLEANTTYNYYLSATNAAGTSDLPTVNSVTTGLDCRVDENGVPLGAGWTSTTLAPVYSGTCNNRTYRIPTQYTKSGCTTSTSYGPVVAAPDCNTSCYTTSTATVYSGTCGNRTSTTRTTYTPIEGSGCTAYSVDGTWVSSPDCNSTCFTSATSTVYSGTCGNRTSATRTTYTAKAGSGCTTYYVDGTYTSDPNCNSTCFTVTSETLYQGTCTNRTSALRITYTAKAGSGCTTYSVTEPYSPDPICDSTCFDTSTSTVYSGTCSSRTSATRTTYTAKAGNSCTTYYVDGAYTASPDCGTVGGACWSDVSASYIGQTVLWAGVYYNVIDLGSGSYWVQRNDGVNQYCPGGYLELYTLWACGPYQGVTLTCSLAS